jgi:hypothetical protein
MFGFYFGVRLKFHLYFLDSLYDICHGTLKNVQLDVDDVTQLGKSGPISVLENA